MIDMLFNGQVSLFLLIVMALVISLSFHEWGHAFAAKMFGDDTAQRAGRLTLNPLAHIDPLGLLMVVLVVPAWLAPAVGLAGMPAPLRVPPEMPPQMFQPLPRAAADRAGA